MSDLDLLRSLGDQIVPPSFDALRETARRRTRRAATVAAAVAAVTVVAVIGTAELKLVDHDSAPPTNPAPKVDTTRPLTYAEGATVHYGDQSVTMPGRVVELDLTDDGVAVRTADDRIWFTDGSAVDEIGAVGDSAWGDVLWDHYVGRMVASNPGSEVAWYEFPQPRSPEVVVYDTHAGQVIQRHRVEMPSGTVGGLFSVDAEAVYGFTDLTYGEDLRPLWRIDHSTGEQLPMYQLKSYRRILERRGLARTLLVSHQQAADPESFVAFDGLQQFSVKGTQIEPEGDQPLYVRDGLTGNDFTFTAPPEYPDTNTVWLVQWLDDDTVVLDAEQRDGVDLLECHVSTSECTIALRAPADAVVPMLADPNSSQKSSD
jgi:hypothetical protein